MAFFYKCTCRLKYLFTVLLLALFVPAFSQSKKSGDSITIAVEPVYDLAGKTHRTFFGEGYRKLWAAPVKMRIFHLSKEKGGLKVLQKGGGMQTKSLRLIDSSGQEWVIRTIQKYPERVLPPTLRKSVAADIIQDQIVTEHPFAALTVPPLANALGIPHANPEVVYVADDPAFGEYRKDYINQVFLFEEREPLDASKTDNTDKAVEKLLDDNDNSVDQKTVLKARLLDMLLGDWDRHEDQWRWERTKGKNGIVYEPVPRDRDQVYYNTSGIFPWLVSHHLLMSKFQSYKDRIRSIERWNLNGRNFDRYFLTELDEKDWEAAITEVQAKLTDKVISDAIKLMPDTIYKLSGAGIIQKLIARRNVLKEQALQYYRFLSKTVEIIGTDKREHIDIINEPTGQLTVKINKLKKEGNQEQVIYKRTFDPSVTNEVRVYAMAGEDVFAVHGATVPSIKLRMIGGKDKDTFAVDSNIVGKGSRFIYDRSDKKDSFPDSRRAHLRTAADTMVNHYQEKNFRYDFLQPLILGSFSRDYGVQFIGNFIWQKQGFHKDPYAFRQNLIVNYGFGANALLLNYNGEFKQVFGKTDLLINVLSKGPNYTTYFFGVGNNTEFNRTGHDPNKRYRNVYNYLAANVSVRHAYDNWRVSIGVAGQYYDSDSLDNRNRYLNTYNSQNLAEKVYSPEGFAGVLASVVLDTRNKSIVPHKGVYWNTTLTGMNGLNSNAHSYGQIQSQFSFYLTPGKDSTLIIADHFGIGTTIGKAAYYQQLTLGGNQNLRGFYSWRFTGKTAAFNNLELRAKITNVTSYLLPGTLGVIGFNDIGRVWTPGEISDKLHIGYGGGLFFLPGQLVIIQAVVGFSDEGIYPYVSAGFRF